MHVLMLLFPVLLWAANLYVTPNPSIGADCSQANPCSLQDALNIAASNGEADTIYLEAGTYSLGNTVSYTPSSTENFSIYIKALDPNNKPVLDGGGSEIMSINTTGLADDSNVEIGVENIVFYAGGVTTLGISASALEIRTSQAMVSVVGCEFRGNTFSLDASVLFVKSNTAQLRDNVFQDNTILGANVTSYLIRYQGSYVSFINNLIENNISTGKPAVAFYSQSSQVVNVIGNRILNNSKYTGLRVDNSVSYVYNNFIVGNTADTGDNYSSAVGSCIYAYNNPAVYIYGNYCVNNTADVGSISIEAGIGGKQNVEIVNNIIYGNSVVLSGGGIGIDISYGKVVITNNTIYNNTALMGGGVFIYSYPFGDKRAFIYLYNNIIYGNRADVGREVLLMSQPSAKLDLNIHYNILSSEDGVELDVWSDDVNVYMDNNIFENPLIANPYAGDFGLRQGSPAIDTGYNDAPALPLEDYRGGPRIVGPNVDIGAVEYDPSSPPSYPNIKLDMVEIDFGNVLKYESKFKDVNIANVGNAPLSVMDIYVLGNKFSLDVSGGDKPCGNTSFTLNPGDNCTVRIYFEGSGEGTYDGVLLISSDDPDLPELSVGIRATVVGWSDIGEVNTNYGKMIFYITEGEFETLKAEKMTCKLPEGYKLSPYGSVRLSINLKGNSDTRLRIELPEVKRGMFVLLCADGKGYFMENASVNGNGIGIGLNDDADGKKDGRIDVYIAVSERGVIQEVVKKKGCSFADYSFIILLMVLIHFFRFRYNLFR